MNKTNKWKTVQETTKMVKIRMIDEIHDEENLSKNNCKQRLP
jgi:hypothetical protein